MAKLRIIRGKRDFIYNHTTHEFLILNYIESKRSPFGRMGKMAVIKRITSDKRLIIFCGYSIIQGTHF